MGVAEASENTFLTIVTAVAASEHLLAEALLVALGLGLGEEVGALVTVAFGVETEVGVGTALVSLGRVPWTAKAKIKIITPAMPIIVNCLARVGGAAFFTSRLASATDFKSGFFLVLLLGTEEFLELDADASSSEISEIT